MGYFQVRYNSRIVNYDRRGFIRLATDWAIYCTLGNFSKPVATINLPKSPTFLGNFCKGVNINHFSSKIIFVQLL